MTHSVLERRLWYRQHNCYNFREEEVDTHVKELALKSHSTEIVETGFELKLSGFRTRTVNYSSLRWVSEALSRKGYEAQPTSHGNLRHLASLGLNFFKVKFNFNNNSSTYVTRLLEDHRYQINQMLLYIKCQFSPSVSQPHKLPSFGC